MNGSDSMPLSCTAEHPGYHIPYSADRESDSDDIINDDNNKASEDDNDGDPETMLRMGTQETKKMATLEVVMKNGVQKMMKTKTDFIVAMALLCLNIIVFSKLYTYNKLCCSKGIIVIL